MYLLALFVSFNKKHVNISIALVWTSIGEAPTTTRVVRGDNRLDSLARI